MFSGEYPDSPSSLSDVVVKWSDVTVEIPERTHMVDWLWRKQSADQKSSTLKPNKKEL